MRQLARVICKLPAGIWILGTLIPGGSTAGQAPPQVPFEVGEVIRYQINYKPLFLTPAFKAGEVRIRLDRAQESLSDDYRVSAWVRSAGILKKLAGLDVRDHFESIMDANNFSSHAFLHQVRTNRKQQDILVQVDQRTRQARLVITDVSSEPAREIRKETFPNIPSDMVDYLSIFYRLRANPLEVGQELEIPLGENGKHKQLNVRVIRSEEVETPIGRYPALLMSTQGGLFLGGGDFQVWLSQDQYRVPVKFQAEVRFGKVFGHLIELKTPRMIKGLVRTP